MIDRLFPAPLRNLVPQALVPLLVALAFALTPLVSLAQQQAENPRLAELEARVQLLEERLNTLLGEEQSAKIFRIPLGNSPVRGASDAPVTLVIFGDYQSDYSARAQTVINRLLAAYPKELKVVYKHYPLRTLHSQAHDAALAAISAMRQGKFWEFHALLYRNSRALDPALYSFLADQIGLNLSTFERDRTSLAALEALSKDEKVAVALGVNGVPSLYLNGRLMQSWRFDYLNKQISGLLKR